MRMLDDDLRERSDGRLNRRERVEKGKREVQSKQRLSGETNL